MMRRIALIPLFLAVLGSFGCGKKGPIVAPIVRVPQPVQDLSLSRIGNRVILSWTNPTAYINGDPLKGLSEVEVWTIEEAAAEGTAPARPGPRDFEKTGRLLVIIPGARPASAGGKDTTAERGSAVLETDAAALAQKFMFFSLRARDERKRPSEFCDPVDLAPAPTLLPPREVRAVVREKSIDLTWTPPEGVKDAASAKMAGYNLYRSEGDKAPVRINSAPLEALEFRDEKFTFGKVYAYFLRSASVTAPGTIESENSESVRVEPADKFPPAAPQGLTVIAGEGFLALSWEPSPEADLAGYRVWRREPGRTELTLLKELPPAESSYSDTEVENNRQYIYAITAFDQAGNESARSAEAAGLARRPRD